MAQFTWPPVSLASSPAYFYLNGVLTAVSKDTTTPANSKPLPVSQLNTSGVAIDPATSALQTTGNTSLSSIDTKLTSQATAAKQDTGNASLASIDTKLTAPLTVSLPTGASTSALQTTGNNSLASIDSKLTSPINTKVLPNTNGAIVNTSLTGTTASTTTAPANAVGFVLQAPSTNTDPIRWCIGSTASTTVGQYFESGRDSGYIPCAANISVCATNSGTNAYSIQWILYV